MTTAASVARPYAQAAFDYALDKKKLNEWQSGLEFCALVAKDKTMSALLKNTTYATQKISQLWMDLCQKKCDVNLLNFIKLLAARRRLAFLPDIAALFNVYRLRAEKQVAVHIESYQPMSDSYKEKFSTALKKWLSRDVIVHYHVNERLLGGAVIYAEGTVMDGSVQDKLTRIRNSCIKR